MKNILLVVLALMASNLAWGSSEKTLCQKNRKLREVKDCVQILERFEFTSEELEFCDQTFPDGPSNQCLRIAGHHGVGTQALALCDSQTKPRHRLRCLAIVAGQDWSNERLASCEGHSGSEMNNCLQELGGNKLGFLYYSGYSL